MSSKAGSRPLDPWAGLLIWILCSSAPPTPGYADHMGLTQFRRRFQVLDPLLMKKLMSAPERVDEKTVCGAR